MREGGLDAVHATVAYREVLREMVANIETWNYHFASVTKLCIFHGLRK